MRPSDSLQAEISMRAWIMQPGTILTHFDSVRYVLTSVVGVLALFAALAGVVSSFKAIFWCVAYRTTAIYNSCGCLGFSTDQH